MAATLLVGNDEKRIVNNVSHQVRRKPDLVALQVAFEILAVFRDEGFDFLFELLGRDHSADSLVGLRSAMQWAESSGLALFSKRSMRPCSGPIMGPAFGSL